MDNLANLKSKISSMASSPGVYLMKDKAGAALYIGKAKSLKRRLENYFGRGLSSKTLALMSRVSDIECRLTQTEAMALILEASLIHKYQPKYNICLRDDKSFPLVKITNEEFPAVYITRKREADGARYFGPYTNAALLRQALKVIRHSFPYRSCKKLPHRACIYYRIKLSPAPCLGKISKAEYSQTIKAVSLILEGKGEALIRGLTQEMDLKAKEHKFEEAAGLRDKILALSTFRPWAYTLKEALGQLKDILGLKCLPRRIEAFDVSNITGLQAAASLVSFYDGLADKDNYRRFRIKTVSGIDDYKMLAEAVSRRYQRLREENLSFPDLILVDGGRGQLSAVKKELVSLNLDIPVISLAKKKEEIYTLSRQAPIRLKKSSSALRLIQHIRDESHRFALKYHHILRRNKMTLTY